MDEARSSLAPDENGFLTDVQAWEQWPDEPPAAYHVFELYCHLPPDNRSVRAAVDRLYVEKGQPPSARTPHPYYDLATKYRWAERSRDYWMRERRRGEVRLQAKRDATDNRIAELGDQMVEKLAKDFSKLKHETYPKSWIEALAKLQELIRVARHDDPEERKRRGRPLGDEGALPAIEEILKPPKDEE
jgi:hypothetical protein